jgi:hypothetical protein
LAVVAGADRLVARVARAAADPQDEQPAAAFADGGEFVRALLDRGFVELRGDLLSCAKRSHWSLL